MGQICDKFHPLFVFDIHCLCELGTQVLRQQRQRRQPKFRRLLSAAASTRERDAVLVGSGSQSGCKQVNAAVSTDP